MFCVRLAPGSRMAHVLSLFGGHETSRRSLGGRSDYMGRRSGTKVRAKTRTRVSEGETLMAGKRKVIIKGQRASAAFLRLQEIISTREGDDTERLEEVAVLVHLAVVREDMDGALLWLRALMKRGRHAKDK